MNKLCELTVVWVNPNDDCKVAAVAAQETIGNVIVNGFGFVQLAKPVKVGKTITLPKGYSFRLQRENQWTVMPE